MLEELGFKWQESREVRWDRAYQYLVEFKAREGHTKCSKGTITEDGVDMGEFNRTPNVSHNLILNIDLFLNMNVNFQFSIANLLPSNTHAHTRHAVIPPLPLKRDLPILPHLWGTLIQACVSIQACAIMQRGH